MIHHLIKKLFVIFYIPAAANIPLLIYYYYKNGGNILLLVLISMMVFILWGYINIFPYKKEKYARKRLRIMMGGRALCFYSFYGFLAQIGIIVFLYPLLREKINNSEILWFNGLYALGINFFLFLMELYGYFSLQNG